MKAVSLISGGLDSTLATKLIIEQGIEVFALNTRTPFCTCDKKQPKGAGCRHEAAHVAEKLGITLKIVNVSPQMLEIIKHPKHGFGSNMNPCIDCRILSFKKAKEYMREIGASFIITGEVLGQRPMSQRRQMMDLIEKEAGLEGLVLRPLSAKLFEPTIPETNGWVDREKLLAISGRSRKEQMALAAGLGINDYPCSAGGCLLTDKGFSQRIKDLLAHDELTLDNVELLKAGRHLRLDDKAKIVVGRDERENSLLEAIKKEGDLIFRPSEDLAGPTVLVRGVLRPEKIEFVCGVLASYCDLDGLKEADIEVVFPSGIKQDRKAPPLSRVEFQQYII
ncbi:MAG: hypothetical protein PHR44_01120 [Candidatus Omnitrophica bacterium]|nr:hypothetical protein [Candidatus Omnitrophota bacterium]